MAGTWAVKLNFYNAKNSLETFHDLYVLCGFGCEIIKGTTVLRFIFDTVFSFTKTSLPLITLSSSCRSARIGKLVIQKSDLIKILTCRDFLRQHRRLRRRTPRLPHNSDKVHIVHSSYQGQIRSPWGSRCWSTWWGPSCTWWGRSRLCADIFQVHNPGGHLPVIKVSNYVCMLIFSVTRRSRSDVRHSLTY